MIPNEIWQTALGQLQMQMTRATFDTWVKNSQGLAYEDGLFVVGVPSGYAKDWLEHRLHPTIKRALTGVLGRSIEVRYVVWTRQKESSLDEGPEDGLPGLAPATDRTGSDGGRDHGNEVPAAAELGGTSPLSNGAGGYHASGVDWGHGAQFAPSSALPAVIDDQRDTRDAGAPVPLTEGLSGRYTFDTFVVGASNRLAHAAALAVAENPARAYNPLFIYGGVGLGKTHLLHAVGHACHTQGLRVMYVSSETFTNDLIGSIKSKTTDRFRDRYRTIDVLLVDDIQFIAGKESTQEEFFHTFNALHGQDRQLIISSDRPPKALVTLEDRLRSRFEWGLIADIQPPDLETRIAILQQKGESSGVSVPYQVIERIARQIQSNIRELEGALNRVMAHARLTGRELTADIVPLALAELMPRPGSVTMKDILMAVAAHYQVSISDLTGRTRSAKVALPRHVAMYLARTEISASLPQIGHEIGGRDHSTVMHACSKVGDQLERNDGLRRDVLAIKERLYQNSMLR